MKKIKGIENLRTYLNKLFITARMYGYYSESKCLGGNIGSEYSASDLIELGLRKRMKGTRISRIVVPKNLVDERTLKSLDAKSLLLDYRGIVLFVASNKTKRPLIANPYSMEYQYLDGEKQSGFPTDNLLDLYKLSLITWEIAKNKDQLNNNIVFMEENTHIVSGKPNLKKVKEIHLKRNDKDRHYLARIIVSDHDKRALPVWRLLSCTEMKGNTPC